MQNNPEKNNSKTLLYIIIAILLLLNVGLAYLWQTGNNKQEILTVSNNEMKAELTGKEEALMQAQLLIDQYRADSLTLAENNIAISSELVAKKNEIAKLVARIKSDTKLSQSTINELNMQLEDLRQRIVELESENAELVARNEMLQEEVSSLNTENDALAKQGRILKSFAERLQSADLKIETLKKKWLTGKETGTVRAKDVEAFRISFSIADNNFAQPGERTIYIKITSPEGVTMANGNEGGTFDYLDKSSRYTYKVSTVFEREAKTIPATIWKPIQGLSSGQYTVELYCEGYRMGSAILNLL